MKLFADRGARDRGDTVVLIKILGITTPKEAEAILECYWPGEGLSKATGQEKVSRKPPMPFFRNSSPQTGNNSRTKNRYKVKVFKQ